MEQEKFVLTVEERDLTTQSAKQLIRNGSIPAILYGKNIPTNHLVVPFGSFQKLFRKAGESTIIELSLGGKTHNVLIQDVHRHYLNNSPIHVDFYEVSMNEKLTATVPFEFIGEAPAVKALGGTLVKVLNEVEVECLPKDLPHTLDISIEQLATFDDSIAIKDIVLPPGVELLAEPEEVVAMVQAPRDVEAELAEPVGEIDVNAIEGVADKPETTEGDESAEK